MNWSLRYANEDKQPIESTDCTNAKYGEPKHAACKNCGDCIEIEPEYQEYTNFGTLNLGGGWTHKNHYGSPRNYRPCHIMRYMIDKDKVAEPMYEGE